MRKRSRDGRTTSQQGAADGRGWVSTVDLADAHVLAAWTGGGEQERRGGLDECEVADKVHTMQLDIYISR
jgi:hypothetical protein